MKRIGLICLLINLNCVAIDGTSKKMKIYVAAKFSDKDQTRAAHNLLKVAGHTITHDWTVNKQSFPFTADPEFTAQCATEDLAGVLAADVLVVLSHAEASMGSAGELGAAIAAKLLGKSMLIYAVGPHFDQNFFYHHPMVQKVDSIDAIVTELKNLRDDNVKI